MDRFAPTGTVRHRSTGSSALPPRRAPFLRLSPARGGCSPAPRSQPNVPSAARGRARSSADLPPGAAPRHIGRSAGAANSAGQGRGPPGQGGAAGRDPSSRRGGASAAVGRSSGAVGAQCAGAARGRGGPGGRRCSRERGVARGRGAVHVPARRPGRAARGSARAGGGGWDRDRLRAPAPGGAAPRRTVRKYRARPGPDPLSAPRPSVPGCQPTAAGLALLPLRFAGTGGSAPAARPACRRSSRFGGRGGSRTTAPSPRSAPSARPGGHPAAPSGTAGAPQGRSAPGWGRVAIGSARRPPSACCGIAVGLRPSRCL